METPRPLGRTFTSEQRAAIDARRGSQLLSANAGSGKTAVMVERFVEAVIADGVPVTEVLALTFTEKAAGELRERLRRRFLDLGEGERAREAETAWVGTIHGFCARVLRAEPLSAGLDPRFDVLDAAAAGRLADRAYDEALEAWAGAHGEAALALAGAYGVGLQPMMLETYGALRSGGQTLPRLPVPPEAAAPDPGRLHRAREVAADALADAREGMRVRAGRAALDACQAFLLTRRAEDPVPVPAVLASAELKNGAAALSVPECEAYRDAWDVYRQACADHHARAAMILLDDLLRRFGNAYAAVKARRGSVDFADLELCARDLFTSAPAVRERWRDRFALLMIDEFQDTNRVQVDVLEALERDNLFAVGDELQSIYGFRHADVTIFRERRAALDAERVRRLTANFRSHQELLDVLNGIYAPVFGPAFLPLEAGRDRPPAQAPVVELLLTDCPGWESREAELGLSGFDAQPWRRVEARRLAERLAAELAAGRRPGEIVVLVRSTGSLRLFEQALEEEGIPTYVLGGRGYWSHEQVRDGLAYLSALANPLDEAALLTVLASPFCGAGADALIPLAQAGRRAGSGLWDALRGAEAADLAHLDEAARQRLEAFRAFFTVERARAERLAPEILLERAVTALGYDLAVLARAGGDRRMANLRKLMRLAREYDSAEGRDLRGFIAFAAGQDLREAREGEAPLEAEDLDAVRLMTIHRAKGLEFPVVAVADLGRQGNAIKPALLTGRDGRVGLRLATLGAGARTDALAYRELADELAAVADEEERRLLYVAMTRAEDRLILSGGTDVAKLPPARPGGPPLNWILPALIDAPATVLAAAEARSAEGIETTRQWNRRPARVRVTVAAAEDRMSATLGVAAAAASIEAPAKAGPPSDDGPGLAVPEASPPAAPAVEWAAASTPPTRLSYTALQAYTRCPYRYYLQTRLGLPDVPAPPIAVGDQLVLDVEEPELDARIRGIAAHRLLEELEFASPAVPGAERIIEVLAGEGVATPRPADVEDIAALVTGFGASPLCRRLAGARDLRREAGFAFAPRPGSEPLMSGVLDVHATEPGGRVLVVDYKTDRLGSRSPADVVEADYAIQRAVYALAALSSGAAEAEVSYCFLERPEDTVSRRFDSSDAPRLTERVLTAGSGILAERWPVADMPHRRLCGDCPGRARLCSYDERWTLRDPAAARPGAPVRSGGGDPARASSSSGGAADTEV